jgi:hypothetical protein
MKTFRIIGMVLMAVLMCVNFTSCSKDDDDFSGDGSNIPKNTIRYQTKDGIIVRFENEDVFGGAKIISNTYSTTNGYGTIEFASEVTAIEKNAFKYQDKLSSITLPNSIVSIGDYAFLCCKNLTSISIPNSVTSIGREAFNDCNGLTSVTIPNSVTSIGYRTFAYCRNLTSVTISNSITNIAGEVFFYCTNLKSITIPNSVTNIGNSAFYTCVGLKSIYLMGTTPPSVGTDNFTDYHYKNITIYIPKGSLEAYQSAYVWKEFKNIQEI